MTNFLQLAISPIPLKPILIEKIWNAPKCKATLANKAHNKPWIFDRRHLVWSTNKVQEIRMTINIDEEKGRPSNDKNTFHVIVRNTGIIRLNALRAYLNGEVDWDTSVLECMSKFPDSLDICPLLLCSTLISRRLP